MCHLILFPLPFSFLHPLIFLIIVFIPDFIFAFVGLVVLCCHDVYILAISLWLSYFGLVRFFSCCVFVLRAFSFVYYYVAASPSLVWSNLYRVGPDTFPLPGGFGCLRFWYIGVWCLGVLTHWGLGILGFWYLWYLVVSLDIKTQDIKTPRCQDPKMSCAISSRTSIEL